MQIREFVVGDGSNLLRSPVLGRSLMIVILLLQNLLSLLRSLIKKTLSLSLLFLERDTVRVVLIIVGSLVSVLSVELVQLIKV